MRTANRFLDWVFIRKCYCASFPPSERKPLSIIWKMYRKNKTDVWIFHHQKRRVGFAATINSPNCVMIDYLAISKSFQSKGMGSRFLQELNQHYSDRALFVEIEYDAADTNCDSEINRRKQFYLNNGMHSMNVHASVFEVPMELLGYRCEMSFADYKAFYKNHYSAYAAEHILEI